MGRNTKSMKGVVVTGALWGLFIAILITVWMAIDKSGSLTAAAKLWSFAGTIAVVMIVLAVTQWG